MYQAILVLTTVMSGITAGIIPATYNLIGSPTIVPQQSLAFGQVSNVVHAFVPVQPVNSLVHPAVVQNAAAESQLPPQLLNNFYKNPNIAANLARESWLTEKEFPVQHRDAEDIPRAEIAKIVDRIEHRG